MSSFASTAQLRAFRPLGNNKTVNIVTTVASQNLPIPDSPLGTRAIRIANVGTELTFIELTTTVGGAAAANTTSMPLLGNTVEVLTFSNDLTSIRVIGVAGGNTVYVTYGEGL